MRRFRLVFGVVGSALLLTSLLRWWDPADSFSWVDVGAGVVLIALSAWWADA